MLQEGSTPVPGYRVEKFLGRGSFGEVWQSSSPGGTKSALKFLNLREQQGRKEFRAIQRLKLVRHALLMPINAMWLLDAEGNVLPDEMEFVQPLMEDTVRRTMMHGMPETKPAMLVMAMPLAERNLMEVLKEKKRQGASGLPVDELLSYMMDAAKAIDFLNSPRHDLGSGPIAIQHGDVKPENLVLMGESILLCDFGVARTMGTAKDTRGTTLGGSLAYMAPECLKGDSASSSDQFSLAITYIELRTGELPFSEASVTQVIEDRKQGRYDISGMPQAEQAVLKRAMQLDPTRRYPTTVALVDALVTAVHGVPTKRSSLLVASIGTIAIASVVAAVALMWPRLPVPNPEPIPATQHDAWKQDYKKFIELAERNFPLNNDQQILARQLLAQAVGNEWEAKFQQPRILSESSNKRVLSPDRNENAMALSPDRKWIATVSSDGTRLEMRSTNNLLSIAGSQDFAPGQLIKFGWTGNASLMTIIVPQDQGSDYLTMRLNVRTTSDEKVDFTSTTVAPIATHRKIMFSEKGDDALLQLIMANQAKEKLYTIKKDNSMVPLSLKVLNTEDGDEPVIDDSLLSITNDGQAVLALEESPYLYLLNPNSETSGRRISMDMEIKTMLASEVNGQSVIIVGGFKRLDVSENGQTQGKVVCVSLADGDSKPIPVDVFDNRYPLAIKASSQADELRQIAVAYDDGSFHLLQTPSANEWTKKNGTDLSRDKVNESPVALDKGYPVTLAFGPRDQWLAVAYTDHTVGGTIYLWKTDSDSVVRLSQKNEEILQMQFTDRDLVVAFKNGTIKSWDLGVMLTLAEFAIDNKVKPDEPKTAQTGGS